MSCRDMGGPCDARMTAETPEEMMKKGGEHVKMSTDAAHMKIAEMMSDMSPEDNKKWTDDFMKKWAMAK